MGARGSSDDVGDKIFAKEGDDREGKRTDDPAPLAPDISALLPLPLSGAAEVAALKFGIDGQKAAAKSDNDNMLELMFAAEAVVLPAARAAAATPSADGRASSTEDPLPPSAGNACSPASRVGFIDGGR